MNTKIHMLLLFVFTLLQSCKAQQSQTQTTLPKIENYTKGELEIKVIPFGFDNPITVGKVKTDGTIHFNWSNDISSVTDPQLYMSSIKNAVGMSFCTTKEVEQNNKEAKSVEAEQLFLYKYEQQVGALFPATKKEIQDNNGINRSSDLVLGSTMSWFYSDSDVVFNAKCTVKNTRKNKYDFNEVTSYTIHFKKGWNMVLNTLVEKENWKSESTRGSLPKTLTKTTITKIPSTINWYFKYWANDELLEKRYQLSQITPVSKEQYKNWLPDQLNGFKRTTYQINKQLEHSKSKSNASLIFEKENQKIEVTIVDGAESSEDLETVQLAFEMNKQFKTQGYANRQQENITQLLFAVNNRIVVTAKGHNITPEQLWEALKNLQIEQLIEN